MKNLIPAALMSLGASMGQAQDLDSATVTNLDGVSQSVVDLTDPSLCDPVTRGRLSTYVGHLTSFSGQIDPRFGMRSGFYNDPKISDPRDQLNREYQYSRSADALDGLDHPLINEGRDWLRENAALDETIPVSDRIRDCILGEDEELIG